MANIFEDERIRKWTIIGAVLGGIAPVATLGDAVTIIDIALGAVILGIVFGLATLVVNRIIDSNQRNSNSTESDNNFTQIAKWTSSPKFLPAVAIGLLILVIAYATNTRSELWGRSIIDVWSSPGVEVLLPDFSCETDPDSFSAFLANSPSKCAAINGSWQRRFSLMNGPTMADIEELVKQDLSENLHFVVVGVGVVGLLIYMTRKSGSRYR